jgi:hypothetical protein
MLVAAMSANVGARAATTWHIDVGNPESGDTGGVTEIYDACDPSGATNGVDGQWFTATPGTTVAVRLAAGTTPVDDLDAYFYDADCNLLAYDAMVTDSANETGVAPAGAAFMIVDLYTGANVSYTVTVS